MPDETKQEEIKEGKKDIYYNCIGLIGVSCGKECIWTAGEQVFYEQKGLYQPKRCKDCAKKMREMRGENKR